ncbi:uncharacterized protein BJ212DRAFT_1522883 [Suillus subaureus]|uniref:Uncharacterized protein n=1 Tax=Suillus subaureus TaxID=48587 RepID=A0A9P7EL34_9AGAM|nr:uncharacterized protein BJ212DRAFT_1522883 [Suillus subaureus]KAG1824371.1 hypothetical protein BJ212DRAFT_1522883 [Suillus subaureus]
MSAILPDLYNDPTVAANFSNHTICLWDSGLGIPCGAFISVSDLSKHLWMHGVNGPAKSDMSCAWGDCGRAMKRESVVRHVEEVHLQEILTFGCIHFAGLLGIVCDEHFLVRPRYSSPSTLSGNTAELIMGPPLSTEPRDVDDLAGPESISPDDITAEFAALEELKRTEEVQGINENELLEGNAFDFDELDRVEQGMIPQAILDEIEMVDYNGEGDQWDDVTLMSSLHRNAVCIFTE